MDRQDIDALLVGALYGELTPADEVRLAAHLDSHPTDRGVLDDLKTARSAVRESRIFELSLEPPQAVSALLLQEAHRRAPKRAAVAEDRASWFYRFTRTFMAHPAMAAAAMLVLVVGVASLLYVKKGDETFAHQEAPGSGRNETVAAPTAAPATESTTAAGEQMPAQTANKDTGPEGTAGSAFRVDLDGNAVGDMKVRALNGRADVAKQQVPESEHRDRQLQLEKDKASSIVVDTMRPQPKELPERAKKTAAVKGAKAEDDAFGYDRPADSEAPMATAIQSGGGGAAPGRGATVAAPARKDRTASQGALSASPPPPPSPVAQPPATRPTPPASSAKAPSPQKPSVARQAENKADAAPEPAPGPATDSSLMAWAKGQHSRAQSLAGNGNCTEAAKVAIAIQQRAPDFYSQYVASDRSLKKCQAYIAAERDAEAERSGKARATKRATTDESAPASK